MAMAMRKGRQVKTKINMGIFGAPFSGKSTLALNMLYLKNENNEPMKVIYIDSENGSIDDYLEKVERDGINLDNLLIFYTTSLLEAREIIQKAKNGENFYDEDKNVVLDANGKPFRADAIVLDGSSVLYKTSIQAKREFSKKRAAVRADKKQDISALEKFVAVDGADIELKDYSQINFDGQSLILDLAASGLHYIITAREKQEMETINIKKNGKDEQISVPKKDKNGNDVYSPEGFKGLDYNVKTFARMYRDSDDDSTVKMMVYKDRTGTFQTHTPIEDPSILDFQKMINNNKGKQDFAVSNTLADDIKRGMVAEERKVLGASVDELEAAVIPTEVPDASANEVMDAKKREAKALTGKLSELQKADFKAALKEANLPIKTADLTTIEDVNKYIEIVSAILG